MRLFLIIFGLYDYFVGQAAAKPGALRSKWSVARVARGLVVLSTSRELACCEERRAQALHGKYNSLLSNSRNPVCSCDSFLQYSVSPGEAPER